VLDDAVGIFLVHAASGRLVSEDIAHDVVPRHPRQRRSIHPDGSSDYSQRCLKARDAQLAPKRLRRRRRRMMMRRRCRRRRRR